MWFEDSQQRKQFDQRNQIKEEESNTHLFKSNQMKWKRAENPVKKVLRPMGENLVERTPEN